MLSFPWQGRKDAPHIEDATLAALLSGTAPEDLAAGLQPVADVLAALRARPAGRELAGADAALAEFRNLVGVSDPAQRSSRRRPALLTSLLSAKAAAVAVATAIVIGGVATAAYAGALPSTAQQVAHDLIGAPAAHAGDHARPPADPAAGRTGRARHHRFRHRWPGCWKPRPHPSGTPSPHPSWTPSPHPSRTPSPHPSCPPRPHPSRTPRPHPSCTPRPHPSRTPSPHPSWTPSPSRSGTPPPYPACRLHRHHHHHRSRHHRHGPGPRPSGTPSPQPSPSSSG